MLGSLLLILMLSFGYTLSRHIRSAWEWPLLFSSSLIIGVVGGTWVCFLAVLLFGYSAGLTSGMALLLLVSLLGLRRIKLVPYSVSYPWLLTTVIAGSLLAYMHWTHDLLTVGTALYSAGDTWGDISLHLTLASYFAGARHFSWVFSIFHGAKLTYPFLFDFTSAMFHRLGWNWHWSFMLPSVLLDLAIVQLIFAVAVKFSGRQASGAIAVALFLCGGSAYGWLYALKDWHAGSLQMIDYSHIPALNLQFTNVVTSILLPQRGFAVGIAVVLLVIWLIYEKLDARTVLGASLLVGLLPFFHVQSWEVGLLILGVYVLLARSWKLIVAALPGIFLAVPQLIWQITHTQTSLFIHSYLGWMRADGESLLNFWWINFGLLIPLMLIVAWMLLRTRDQFKRALGLLSLGLFILCNVLILQPNPYDNIKTLLYWYIILCLLGADFFARRPWTLPFATLICLSGILTIHYDASRSDKLVSGDQVAWSEQVQRATPEGSLILTAQQNNHPINMLSGRPVVLGYTGWLWTYGINSTQTSADIQTMYAGGAQATALLIQYGIKYVEVGPEEYAQYQVNDLFFKQFPAVAGSELGTLYRIR